MTSSIEFTETLSNRPAALLPDAIGDHSRSSRRISETVLGPRSGTLGTLGGSLRPSQVTEHGKPVGQLVPVRRSLAERLEQLVEANVIAYLPAPVSAGQTPGTALSIGSILG